MRCKRTLGRHFMVRFYHRGSNDRLRTRLFGYSNFRRFTTSSGTSKTTENISIGYISLESEKISHAARSPNACQEKHQARAMVDRLLRLTECLDDDIADPNLQDHVKSIHKSLMNLTQWNLALAEEENDLKLAWDYLSSAVEVARRSFELSLPFHMPLYERCVNCLASIGAGSDLADQLLEVSSWASVGLDTPIEISFFEETFHVLMERQRYDQVVVLLNGIKARHNLDIDHELSVDLLSTLNEDHNADPTKFFCFLDREALTSALQESAIQALAREGTISEADRNSILEGFSSVPDDSGASLVVDSVEDVEDCKVEYEGVVHSSGKHQQREPKVSIKVLGEYVDGDHSYQFFEVGGGPTETTTGSRGVLYDDEDRSYHIPDIWNQIDLLKFTPKFEDVLLKRLVGEVEDFGGLDE